ncbi:hypothetical protein HYQ44_001169 [Verticillium longisporum]|nr:hypothetical protein HYQ44_001169 [Verticillium longisporum]
MSALRPNQREKAASKHGSSGIAAGLANGIANGLIDPTKLGKYPVLLSDTLLGRTQKDVFTGVRYNHKPQLSSDQAPALARLKPETPGTKDNFELSYSDAGGTYGYAGTRSTDSNQYVLYFDDAKKAFILDRVDSTFNMNLTRTPETTDPERLRQQFEHLDTSPPARDTPKDTRRPASKPAASKAGPAPKASAPKASAPKASALKNSSSSTSQPRRPAPEKKQAKTVELALPPPPPVKEKRKPAKMDDEDDDEDDDDDFGLTVEYPDEPANARSGTEFSPAFPAQKIAFRRFSEFLRDSEADDADGESDQEEDRGIEGFKLPSPVNDEGQQQQQQQQQQYEDSEDEEYNQMFEDVDRAPAQQQQTYVQQEAHAGHDDDDDDDDDMDLEAELEDALEQAANSGDAGEESEVSEED